MTIQAAIKRYCKHLLHEHGPVGLRHRLADVRRMTRLMGSGTSLSSPPHDLELYRGLLRSLRNNPRCHAISLEDCVRGSNIERDLVNFVLRHDLDAGRPEVIRALCDAELEFGLRSSVHILVDGELYNPMTLVSIARELHDQGFDVGLHTQAWMHSDYRSAFRADVAKFESLFGFPPRTFSQHGAWPRTDADLRRRRRFTLDTPELIRSTSIRGCPVSFDWVSEDSCVRNQPVPLTTRFFQVANGCFLGGTALILTHDNHWKP